MDKDFSSLLGAIALNSIFGYEPKTARSLLDGLGSADAVFKLSRNELIDLFGPYSPFLQCINDGALEAAEKEFDFLSGRGFSFLPLTSEHYPALLRDCADAPVLLYVRSDIPAEDIFNKRPAVSVVGTRDISPYGKEWCEATVVTMSQAPTKPMIVSGLAIGVDITAHMAALASGLPTVAVLPVPIDKVYPQRHSVAAGKIAASPGSALVTDFPPGTAALPYNFLRRNRIIAGLSGATVLVESKLKGGGTMTARLAYDYGREVFAVPGRLDDIRSQGCNLLLKEKVAEPVFSPESLCESLGLGSFNRRKAVDLDTELSERYSHDMDAGMFGRMKAIAGLIRRRRGICLDELCRGTGFAYSEVSMLAGMLEADGFIECDLLQRYSIRLTRNRKS